MTPGRRVQGAAERRPVVLLVGGVCLYALGPVLVGGADSSGPVISFWRLWGAVVLLGVVAVVYRQVTGRSTSREGWRWAGRCGVVFGGNQLLNFSALRTASVVDVTLMMVLQPVLVAVLAVHLFGERPGTRFRLWSAVAVVGAAVVAVGGSSGPEGEPLGMALAAASMVLFAVYFVWSKQAREHIDVVPFLWGAAFVAGLTVTAFAVVTGERVGSVSSRDLLVSFTIAVTGSLGHFVSTWPLRWVPANVPPLLQLAIPLIAGSLAWVFLDQGITMAHVLGGALTIVGVAGALRSPAGRSMMSGSDLALAAGGPD